MVHNNIISNKNNLTNMCEVIRRLRMYRIKFNYYRRSNDWLMWLTTYLTLHSYCKTISVVLCMKKKVNSALHKVKSVIIPEKKLGIKFNKQKTFQYIITYIIMIIIIDRVYIINKCKIEIKKFCWNGQWTWFKKLFFSCVW